MLLHLLYSQTAAAVFLILFFHMVSKPSLLCNSRSEPLQSIVCSSLQLLLFIHS